MQRKGGGIGEEYCNGVVSGARGVRARAAIARDGGVDEARVDGGELCVREAERVGLAGYKVFNASMGGVSEGLLVRACVPKTEARGGRARGSE